MRRTFLAALALLPLTGCAGLGAMALPAGVMQAKQCQVSGTATGQISGALIGSSGSANIAFVCSNSASAQGPAPTAAARAMAAAPSPPPWPIPTPLSPPAPLR